MGFLCVLEVEPVEARLLVGTGVVEDLAENICVRRRWWVRHRGEKIGGLGVRAHQIGIVIRWGGFWTEVVRGDVWVDG